MRSQDISGLVSLYKFFRRGAQGAAAAAVFAAGAASLPDFPIRGWAALIAVLSAIAWFVLGRAYFAAARVVVPVLLAVTLFLLWDRWSALSSPASDMEVFTLLMLGMLTVVPIQGALGLLLPRARDASRSPHVRALFGRGPLADPAHARLLRWLRGARALPILVVILMVLGGLAIILLLDPQSREESRSTRRTVQTLIATAGGGELLWARRRSARRGADVRRLDRRSPVLLLRSFGDDMMRLKSGARWTRANDLARRGMTFERIVTGQLARVGPVIAIGRPKEALAPLGAARDYVSDDVWQPEVEQRMREARIIVLMLGSSEGLAWELLRVQRLHLLQKLVLLFPPADDLQQRWRTLRAHHLASGTSLLPDALDPARVLALLWAEHGQPLALEGQRTEWAYETAIRLAAVLVPSTQSRGASTVGQS